MTAKCGTFWGTRETLTMKDSHGETHRMEVPLFHDCFFMDDYNHPKLHECPKCHDHIKAEPRSNE